MKISELENCPQWLKNALTQNADVATCDCGCGQIIWKDGTWENGLWKDGIWEGGTWKDGTWKDGTWEGGNSAIRSKYVPKLMTDGTIEIGCKTFTRQEWDRWFLSDEEFETKRGTESFRLIAAHYNALVAWAETMEFIPRRETK